MDGGSSLANVKANPLFVKEAQLNIYNGMPKEMDNELSQRLKQERDMYEERSKRRVSSKL